MDGERKGRGAMHAMGNFEGARGGEGRGAEGGEWKGGHWEEKGHTRDLDAVDWTVGGHREREMVLRIQRWLGR